MRTWYLWSFYGLLDWKKYSLVTTFYSYTLNFSEGLCMQLPLICFTEASLMEFLPYIMYSSIIFHHKKLCLQYTRNLLCFKKYFIYLWNVIFLSYTSQLCPYNSWNIPIHLPPVTLLLLFTLDSNQYCPLCTGMRPFTMAWPTNLPMVISSK